MASTASAASGSVFGAVGSIAAGNVQGNALDTSAEINRQNSALALETGAYDANRQSILADHKIGGVQAAYAGNGVASDSGSVLDVIGASRANAELDRLNILHGADVKSINYQNQASIEQAGASSARSAGYVTALSSVMMGGSKIFGNSSGATTQLGGTGTGSSGGDGSGEGEDDGSEEEDAGGE